MRKALSDRAARLSELSSRRVMQNPGAYIDQKRMELDHLSNGLLLRYERLIARKKQDYVKQAAMLDALSPLKVLARGYSIVTNGEGRALSTVEGVEPGDKLSLKLRRGTLNCTVDEVIR